MPHVVCQADCCTAHVLESADQLLEGAGSVLSDDAVYECEEDEEAVNESVVG